MPALPTTETIKDFMKNFKNGIPLSELSSKYTDEFGFWIVQPQLKSFIDKHDLVQMQHPYRAWDKIVSHDVNASFFVRIFFKTALMMRLIKFFLFWKSGQVSLG